MLKAGARNNGTSTEGLLHKNTEDVQNEIDSQTKDQDGNISGVSVPVPVPSQREM